MASVKLSVSELKGRLLPLWQRYRIPLVLFLAGLVLVFWPSRSSPAPSSQKSPDASFDLEQTQLQLARILRQIDGAGRVELMLTLAAGQETVYQTDERLVTNESGATTERDTVLLSQSGSQKEPVVALTKFPRFRGALVVCDGADKASVRLAIVEAVSSLTGLGSDHISVIKMKGQ